MLDQFVGPAAFANGSVGETDGEGEGDGLGITDGDGVGKMDGDGSAEGDGSGLGSIVGDGIGNGDGVGITDGDGYGDGKGDGEGSGSPTCITVRGASGLCGERSVEVMPGGATGTDGCRLLTSSRFGKTPSGAPGWPVTVAWAGPVFIL